MAKESDPFGYVTYVFELLDKEEIERLDTKYIMCTRWPNWDHRELKLFEEGYLSFKVMQAGIDKWFDGSNFVPYKYTNIQFERFLEKLGDEKHEFKM